MKKQTLIFAAAAIAAVLFAAGCTNNGISGAFNESVYDACQKEYGYSSYSPCPDVN